MELKWFYIDIYERKVFSTIMLTCHQTEEKEVGFRAKVYIF